MTITQTTTNLRSTVNIEWEQRRAICCHETRRANWTRPWLTAHARISVVLVGLMGGATPAFGQFNNLDIHLNQQLENRLQDHQNAGRRQPIRRDIARNRKSSTFSEDRSQKSRDNEAHPDVVLRLVQKNMKTLEARIPQGRKISIAKDGTVVIHVAGHIDEQDVVAFAESLLETRVILMPIR